GIDRVLGLVVVELAERDHDHATLAVEPRVVSGSSEPIVCRVQSTLLGPLTRDLIRLTVLDRFEPLFAGIRVLRPSVRDHVAAAGRADLGDDPSAAGPADSPLVPVMPIGMLAFRLLGLDFDRVPIPIDLGRDHLAILVERERTTPCPYIHPIRAIPLVAPIA